MRIDGDRIGTGESVKWTAGNAGRAAVGEDCKEAAVGSINVQAGCVFLAEVGDAVDRIEDAESCRTKCRDDGSDAAELQALFERGQVERAVGGGGDGLVPSTDYLGDARVCVVRLCARQHDLVRVKAARDPQRLEVRDRARRRQMREVRLLVQHPRNLIDRLLLEVRGRWPTIEGVIIGVEQHRHRVARPRHWVWGFEHLAEVLRICERIRLPKSIGQRIECFDPLSWQLAVVVR